MHTNSSNLPDKIPVLTIDRLYKKKTIHHHQKSIYHQIFWQAHSMQTPPSFGIEANEKKTHCVRIRKCIWKRIKFHKGICRKLNLKYGKIASTHTQSRLYIQIIQSDRKVAKYSKKTRKIEIIKLKCMFKTSFCIVCSIYVCVRMAICAFFLSFYLYVCRKVVGEKWHECNVYKYYLIFNGNIVQPYSVNHNNEFTGLSDFEYLEQVEVIQIWNFFSSLSKNQFKC